MSVHVHRQVVYATIPGYRPLELDLYVGPAPRALCVWLHGGGWRVGSRGNGPGPVGTGATYLHRMAERGLAVASVEYRLSGEATYPAQRDDVVAACRFLRDAGAELGVGGLPLVLWGTSAGGHLACICALASPVADDVAAVASWSAPVDLLGLADDLAAIGEPVDRGPGSREALLLGGPLDEQRGRAIDAGPLTHVHPMASPFLLVHGTADRSIPIAQTERFAAALMAAGVPVRTQSVDGADHFYGAIPTGALDALVDETTDFLLDAVAR